MATTSKETDPLLPNDKGSPEITGDREESHEEYETEDNIEETPSWKRLWIHGYYCFAILAFAYLATAIYYSLDYTKTAPLTLDERVAKILSETPLIGWCFPLSSKNMI